MDSVEREAILAELAEAFGEAVDVTPGENQPLHVLLRALPVPASWGPSPTRAVLRFAGWPGARPEFYVDAALIGPDGGPPKNHHPYYVLGETWHGFSFQFPWPAGDRSATQAVLQWVNRFRLA